MNETIADLSSNVNELTVRIGTNGPTIIQSVSLQIKPGEILGVVGESGSGKTTLGLAFLWHAKRGASIASGSVHHGSVDLSRCTPKQIAALRGSFLAYVPQDPATALDPARRIRSQLREAMSAAPAMVEGSIDAREADLLESVGLHQPGRILRSFAHQLSGGQLQRIALAIAFAARPKFVVLDEPTTGLDVVTQRVVIELVRSLCRRTGVAAVYITHDLGVVSELADSVAVMYGGNVVESGSAAAVLSRPSHPYSRALLAARPGAAIGRRVSGIPGSPPRPGERPPGCPFAPRCRFHIPRCDEKLPDFDVADPAAVSSGHVARCIRLRELEQTRHDTVQGMPKPTVAPPMLQQPLAIPPPRSERALLEVAHLTASYGQTNVLQAVDLSIGQGVLCALVGESGSGKTTLARCIAGLQTEWDGVLALDGESLPRSVRARSRAAAAAIQYVFQNPYASLNPRRTVGQTLEDPLSRLTDLRGPARRDRVLHALDLVALPRSVLKQFPQELSGGERQRVALARAIAVEPRVLICDEVTSALDVSVQGSVLETLRTLRKELQIAILYITHDLAVARSEADEIVVLREGRVVESGDTKLVMQHPESEYTRTLLENMPQI